MCQRYHSGIAASVISSFTGAILNLIGITILNQIYGRVAIKLNDWENYQKETEYQDALTIKFFIFSFVNSYTSIFYIAFFKVCCFVVVEGSIQRRAASRATRATMARCSATSRMHGDTHTHTHTHTHTPSAPRTVACWS